MNARVSAVLDPSTRRFLCRASNIRHLRRPRKPVGNPWGARHEPADPPTRLASADQEVHMSHQEEKRPRLLWGLATAALSVTVLVGSFIDCLATSHVATVADLRFGPVRTAERN